MNAAEAAWSAGLFDGEGCITIKRQRGRRTIAPFLIVQMTDEDVVRRFHAVVRFGNVRGPIYDKRRPQNKPLWRWSVGSWEAFEALSRAWRPWLGQRRLARLAEVREMRGVADRARATFTKTHIGTRGQPCTAPEGCEKPQHSRGLCHMHYQRARRS